MCSRSPRNGGRRLVPHLLRPRLGRSRSTPCWCRCGTRTGLSPTALYVNAQEQKNITTKCLTNARARCRYNVDADSGNDGPQGITATGVVRWYYNPFSVDGGTISRSKSIPTCRRARSWRCASACRYGTSRTRSPNVAEVLTRRDYYRIDWPLRTRRREFGVYAEETLAGYAPFAFGILNNIGNG